MRDVTRLWEKRLLEVVVPVKVEEPAEMFPALIVLVTLRDVEVELVNVALLAVSALLYSVLMEDEPETKRFVEVALVVVPLVKRPLVSESVGTLSVFTFKTLMVLDPERDTPVAVAEVKVSAPVRARLVEVAEERVARPTISWKMLAMPAMVVEPET